MGCFFTDLIRKPRPFRGDFAMWLELFDRTLCGYPKKDRMKAACDLMWNIQKAVLRCEDSNIDRVAVSNILDAATQKNQRKTTQSQDVKNRAAQDRDVQDQDVQQPYISSYQCTNHYA